MAVTHIEGQIYLSLQIQNEEMPESPNLISVISINESVMQMTPVMQFTFNDMGNSLTRKLALTEGTKLKLLLGKYKESAIPREFRLFGFKQVPTREGPKLAANFIIDAPKYISGSYTEAFDGTSSDAIAQIASRCGLRSDVTNTSDQMTWLNFGQTRAAFAEDIAMHGYINDSSCMYRALTSEKVLKYKDAMSELNTGKVKVTLGLNSIEGEADQVIQVRDIRDVSVSGAMNNWVNYGWKYPEHSLSGEEQLHSEYTAQTSGQYLPINSEIKGELDGARIEYCPKLDCRNTHKNYNKAYYINLRGKALLSERLHLLIEEPSNIQLLDVVEFRHTEADGHTGKATGKYIVTAKVTYIKNGSAYFEKLEICRASLKESGNTPLIG